MLEIHNPLLWTGNAMEIREPRPLFTAGIAAVVDVAYEEPPAPLPRQFIYCRFPINDGGGNDSSILLHAVQCVFDFLVSDTRTIVACSAGMSRSPTIAAFALAAYLDQSPEDVVSRIAVTQALELTGPLWDDVTRVFPRIRRLK
ncbi:MAG: protein phosphatase [Planctomycetaceae bacterium]